jgi:hypothetical protein
MSFPLIRRFVVMPGQKLTPQILQTNGNDKDPCGTGGTCFGDSGGPVFHNGVIVGVTSYTYTNNCRYLGGVPARRHRRRTGLVGHPRPLRRLARRRSRRLPGSRQNR